MDPETMKVTTDCFITGLRTRSRPGVVLLTIVHRLNEDLLQYKSTISDWNGRLQVNPETEGAARQFDVFFDRGRKRLLRLNKLD